MPDKAPRRPERFWHGSTRGAWLAVCFWLAVSGGAHAADVERCVTASDAGYPAASLQRVCYRDVPGAPIYGHAVLGATPEWDALVLYRRDGSELLFRADRHVFEDIVPRLQDLDGDGAPEVIAVQSGFDEGARLFVLAGPDYGRVIATPYIGQRNRWLAPIGAADLDGDGFIELAYVDRPHLAKTLRVWRYRNDTLEEVASLKGVSNHRIGEDFISGGVRDCGSGPEIVTPDAAWRRIIATRLVSDALSARDLAPFSKTALSNALICR